MKKILFGMLLVGIAACSSPEPGAESLPPPESTPPPAVHEEQPAPLPVPEKEFDDPVREELLKKDKKQSKKKASKKAKKGSKKKAKGKALPKGE